MLEHLQQSSACDPSKILFTSTFSSVWFCNPSHKTKTGRANRWGTTNSKPWGPIIMMSQSKTLSSSQIIFYYTLFWRCTVLLCHLAATTNKLCNCAEPQPFSQAKLAYFFTFLHPILMCNITY